MPKCPDCDADMVIREGRYGLFWGCTRYPDCCRTVNYEDVDEDFQEPLMSHDGSSYGECLRCGSVGELSEMGLCSYCQHMWDKD